MNTPVTSRWDAFWRRHPRLLLWTVIVLVVVIALHALRSYVPNAVVYQAF